MEQIPYIAYESGMIRLERANRRTWIMCIILIISLIGSNVGWLIYESQWDKTVTTQEVDQEVDTGDGDTTVIGIGDNNG